MAVPNNSNAEKQLTDKEKYALIKKQNAEKFKDTQTGKDIANRATVDPQKEMDKIRDGKSNEETATKDGTTKKDKAETPKSNFVLLLF